MGRDGFEHHSLNTPKNNHLTKSGENSEAKSEANSSKLDLFSHWYKDPLSKYIALALRDSIRIHGPITEKASSINSAVKLVYGVLKDLQAGKYDLQRSRAIARKGV